MTIIIDESKNSRNYTPAAMVGAIFGFPRTLEFITIHHWGSYGQDFDVVTNYLCTNTTPTSAHFTVERGRAACIVSPADAAWHAGNAKGNASSIGIECRPEASAEDYAAVVELIVLLRSIYGDLPLVRHADWTSTACPGVWDLAKLDAAARGHSAPVFEPPVYQSVPKPDSKRRTYGAQEIHWQVEKGDTLWSIARYYGVPDRVQWIAEYNGIKPEALVVGENIWIPGRLEWYIEAPDSIRSVAAYYGLDADYLARLNGLPSADTEIYIGNTLLIKE